MRGGGEGTRERELRRRVQGLLMLREVARGVLRAESEEDALALACRTSVEIGGYRGALALRLAGHAQREGVESEPWTCAHLGSGAPASEELAREAHGLLQDVLNEGRVRELDLPAALARLGFGGAFEALCRAKALKTTVALPVRIDGVHRAGLLVCCGREGLEPEELALMKELALEIEAGLVSLRLRAERHRTESELRESEERFRTLFEGVPIGLFRSTAEGRIIDANTALARMLGFERGATLSGLSLFKLPLLERDREALGDLLAGHAATRDIEFGARRLDGREMRLRLSVRLNIDTQGETRSLEGTMEDVTERRRAEEALAGRTRELGERVQQLHCLHTLSNLVQEFGTDIGPVAAGLVEPLAAAMRRRDGAGARIVIDGRSVSSEAFKESDWRLVSPIISRGIERGRVEVCYLDALIGEPLFSASERELVETIALRLGNLVEQQRVEQMIADYQAQLRQLASDASLTEERERRRIATALHDGIGQNLAVTKIRLERLRASCQTDEQSKAIDDLLDLTQESIAQTRALTVDLSPPILYELGLSAALEWLAEQTESRHGLPVTFGGEVDDDELGESLAVLVFQAVRELLFNVVKHAGASQGEISMRRVGEALVVNVIDDGRGFDTSHDESPATGVEGFGLFSIQERLRGLGGRMAIESSDNQGTVVSLWLPLVSSESPKST